MTPGEACAGIGKARGFVILSLISKGLDSSLRGAPFRRTMGEIQP
jgi:hypothetical protein